MIIVWHENDLRTADNKALTQAAQKGVKILPLFIFDEEKKWPLGGCSRWWLHHALVDLDNQYKKIDSRLILKTGKSLDVLLDLIKEHKVEGVYFNLRFEPQKLKRDLEVKKELEKLGIEVALFNSNHLINPENFLNQSNKPYAVFTPFYNAILKTVDLNFKLASIPKHIQTPTIIHSEKIKDLGLLSENTWYKKLETQWNPKREEIKTVLLKFVKIVKNYSHDRDIPSVEGTSKLSPYLHFGQISVREVICFLKAKANDKDIEMFVRQLIWREFAMCFLYHFPYVGDKNWKEKFDKFPWKGSKKDLEKWKKGETGYPIVDAGMKELWETGWMHNRVRMIVASFLIKDLMIDWKEGAYWFWDTLVDADLANNTLGWQWVAGSGPDASPFFRIFNPMLQGEKFDPEGEYVKKYLPQLKKLPKEWIHNPWLAPKEVLTKANITLGSDYPLPMVNHNEKRLEALEAYKALSEI